VSAAAGAVGWDDDGVKRAVAVSCAVHVVVAGALVVMVHREEPSGADSDDRAAIAIDVVDVVEAPAAVVAPPAVAQAQVVASAGRPRAVAKQASAAVAAAAEDLVDVVAMPGAGHGDGDRDRDGNGDGDRDGGGGHGLGGRAAQLAAAPLASPPPPPPRESSGHDLSRARPARLVYPSRDSETDPDRLFVAVVTVDTDGYVVGAHLTTGEPGPIHDDAAGLIFKFRYDPARDDAGRPIRSTFEQPFQLAR
jgi:hypothetical protein